MALQNPHSGSARRGRMVIAVLGGIAALGFSAPASPAAAQAFLQYDLPTANARPNAIVSHPNGRLYFTELDGNKIGRIQASSGTINETPVPTANSMPYGIAVGSDGNIWFTQFNTNKIGRLNIDGGSITEFTIPTANSNPMHITPGVDGALYFTENLRNKIGRITTAGVITEFTIPTPNNQPNGIVSGADGKIYFAARGRRTVGWFDPRQSPPVFGETDPMPPGNAPLNLARGPDGSIIFTTESYIFRLLDGALSLLAVPTASSYPWGVVTGYDGRVWFTEQDGNRIGQIDYAPGYPLAEHGVPIPAYVSNPQPSRQPTGITAGPDGAIWFTERVGNRISRIMPPATNNDLLASTLPYTRSVQTGQAATIFTSMINNTGGWLNQCGIAPITPVAGDFVFQTTNPATNALSGTVNTRVDIPPGGLQTFMVGFNTRAPHTSGFFSGPDVKLGYTCLGGNPKSAASASMLNTWNLRVESTPVPDIIAVGLTPSNDGYVRTGGPNGTGAFAVAVTNVGGPGTVYATAGAFKSDRGDQLTEASILPVASVACETNPATGACKAPPESTIIKTFGQNETATFTFFFQASGDVPPDPAHSRAVAIFFGPDSNNDMVLRGATSAAITTQ